METIKIGTSKNNVVISFSRTHNPVVDLTSYQTYLVKILEKTNFKGDPAESYFAYLINLIFTNNLAEQILEEARHLNCDHIEFQGSAQSLKPEALKVSGILEQADIMADICYLILQSRQARTGELTVGFSNGEAPVSHIEQSLEVIEADPVLQFQPEAVRTLKERLNVDLIAFQFVKKNEPTEQGRFNLPIYVAEAIDSAAANVAEQQILAWASIHYLQMLTKIHDFFISLYEPDAPKGFQNDDLMVALIDRLDYELMPYPSGLEKSLEVGRATSGKCAFLVGPVDAVSIPPEIMITLQAKDALGVVPKIRSFTLKGV